MADVTKDEACCKGVKDLPFTAWGKQQWESYDATKDGDYAGACLPFGLLRSVGGPHPVQIIQDDKYIAMMYEQNSRFHVMPIHGRPHPKDIDPTWFGNSVGHWEGDTLVIDTIGFNGRTRIDTIGHPHSDQLHTIERFRRTDRDHIDYVITIDDPKTYTKPWDSVRRWTLHPDWEIMEYSCEENNKSLWEGRIKVPSRMAAKNTSGRPLLAAPWQTRTICFYYCRANVTLGVERYPTTASFFTWLTTISYGWRLPPT